MRNIVFGIILGGVSMFLYHSYSASYYIWLTKVAVNLEDLDKTRYLDEYVERYIEKNPNLYKKISFSFQKNYIHNIQKIKSNVVNIYYEQATKKKIVYELLDYNCIYCKKFHREISGWIKDNTDYEIIYIQLPIISESSFLISKLFLAVGYISKLKQQELHNNLMKREEYISEKDLYNIIENIGLDIIDVKKIALANNIDENLKETIQLSRSIGITGTPAFIKDNSIIIGGRNKMNFLKFLNKPALVNQT